MSETHFNFYPENKKELYSLLEEQLNSLTKGMKKCPLCGSEFK